MFQIHFPSFLVKMRLKFLIQSVLLDRGWAEGGGVGAGCGTSALRFDGRIPRGSNHQNSDLSSKIGGSSDGADSRWTIAPPLPRVEC